jgi:hypothetical protein
MCVVLGAPRLSQYVSHSFAPYTLG